MSRLLRSCNLLAKTIHLPGGWREDLDTALVDQLAEELRAGRVLPPVRVTKDYHLVQGRHRVAAHLQAKVPEVRADVVLYESEVELEIDQLNENLKRRSVEARDQVLARLVELTTARVKGEIVPQNGEESRKPGRPPEPERTAIREVASKAGVSENTVERAVKKARPKPPGAENSGSEPAPDIQLWGITDVPGVVLQTAREAQVVIDEADRMLRNAQAALTKLQGLLAYPQSVAQELHKRAKELALAVRVARPAALCPYCKAAVNECSACDRTRLALEQQMAGVPPELLKDGDEAMVSVRGALRPRAAHVQARTQAVEIAGVRR